MKNEILTNLPDLSAATIAHWEPTWTHNSSVNRPRLLEGLDSGTIHCLSRHPKEPFKTGLILGSGVSADDIDWNFIAAHRDRVYLLCATSNMSIPLKHGITPDAAMVVDASPMCGTVHIDDIGGPRATRHIELFAPPIIDPSLIDRWRGPMYIYRPHQPGNHFLESVLPKMYSKKTTVDVSYHYYTDRLQIGILNAGCVANGCVLVGNYLGLRPIGLLGMDWGWSTPKGRATQYTLDRKSKTWTPYPFHPILSGELLHASRHPGLYTTLEMLQYKLNMFIVWRLSEGLPLYLTSNTGLLRDDEMPRADLTDLIINRESAIANYPITGEALSLHIDACLERMGIVPPKPPLSTGIVTSAPPTVVSTTSPLETSAPVYATTTQIPLDFELINQPSTTIVDSRALSALKALTTEPLTTYRSS